MIPELMREGDRRTLWRKALRFPEYGVLFDCMRAYVRVSAKADNNAIVDKIAEQVEFVYSQLSEQMHTRPNAGDLVSLDATLLGHRNAHLVSCIAESLYIKYQIINDNLPDSLNDSTQDKESEGKSSSEESSSS